MHPLATASDAEVQRLLDKAREVKKRHDQAEVKAGRMIVFQEGRNLPLTEIGREAAYFVIGYWLPQYAERPTAKRAKRLFIDMANPLGGIIER